MSLPTTIFGAAAWKIGAGFAVVVMLLLGGLLVKTTLDRNAIVKQRDALTKKIEDPVTGYIARLRTSENNVITLKAAVARQNAVFKAQSDASKKELNRLRGELKVAQAESAALRVRVSAIINKPIKGNTLEERVLDVDKKVLEDLEK